MGNPAPTIFNDALADELIVINAVYGDDTAVITYSDVDHTTVEVRLPQDQHTYHIRFPASYPSDCSDLTGIHPLHFSTKPTITNQICFFRACLIAGHVTDEVSFYDSIVRFDEIRQAYQELPPRQAESLSQRDRPRVNALQEQLSILAEAAQTALISARSPPDRPPPISECSVCLEPVFTPLAAVLPNCSHPFCSACLQAGIQNFLDTRAVFKCCGEVPPPKLVERFANLDHASMIRYTTFINEKADANPIFCHQRTCSAYIPSHRINEHGAPCPVCSLLTCPSCKKAMHEGVCSRDLRMLHRLAKDKKWKFCPGCKQLVERSEGCKSMMCTCGVVFCYNCGKAAPPGAGHVAGNCCLKGVMFDTMVRRRQTRAE